MVHTGDAPLRHISFHNVRAQEHNDLVFAVW